MSQLARQVNIEYPNIEILTDPAQGAAFLQAGGLLLYPTETFYALGCMANNPRSVKAIFSLKNRNSHKPLSLLAANTSQAPLAADLTAAPKNLLDVFWPGPLTLVLPASPDLPAELKNVNGKTAIRATSNHTAAVLAQMTGFPLVATSANLSGEPPSRHACGIDKGLLLSLSRLSIKCGLFIAPAPIGNYAQKPSTIVEPLDGGPKSWRLKLIREGCVPMAKILEVIGQ